MKTSKWLAISVLGILIISAVIWTSFAQTSRTEKAYTSQDTERKSIIKASARVRLVDADELASSDLIIIGTVVDVLPSHEGPIFPVIKGEVAAETFRMSNPGVGYKVVKEDISPEEYQKEQERAASSREIYTNKIVKVEKYIRVGKRVDTKIDLKTIIISERGGEVGNRVLTYEGYDPLKVGERVLLFLNNNGEKGEEGTFVTAGFFQGLFRVENNMIVNKDPSKDRRLIDMEQEIATLTAKHEALYGKQ